MNCDTKSHCDANDIDPSVFNCLYMTCEEDIHRANMIRELLQARDGQLDISMSPCEVRTLLEYVCTM